MSDINQPCPTICSACKGKCSDQLVLPAGCVLRPTIERVEAVLTEEWVSAMHASLRNSLGMVSIHDAARAISREVVAILAEPREPLTSEQLANYLDSYNNDRRLLGDQDAFYGVMLDVWDAANGISTPAASGIGESGGE